MTQSIFRYALSETNPLGRAYFTAGCLMKALYEFRKGKIHSNFKIWNQVDASWYVDSSRYIYN